MDTTTEASEDEISIASKKFHLVYLTEKPKTTSVPATEKQRKIRIEYRRTNALK